VDTYALGDELEGKVTKVVSFGAFVEILDGVEGLVHISELAQHHVENPREVVNQGDVIKVKILEIDSERRRLSLSAKRVEGQELPLRDSGGEYLPPSEGSGEELGEVRDLDLSDDVFAAAGEEGAAPDAGADAPAAETPPEADASDTPAPGDALAAEGDAAAPAGDTPAPGDAISDEPTGDAVAAEGDADAPAAEDAVSAEGDAAAPADEDPAAS
jgi:small subunit ribosomal protein S1